MATLVTYSEIIPVSGKWVWKDDPSSPSIEFISNNPNADKQEKRRKVKGGDGKGRGDRTSSGIQRGGMLGRGKGLINKFHKPMPSKKEQNDHVTVTLEDIKSVTLERMSEVHPIHVQFESLYRKEPFDSFIIHLLNYFDCFFHKMALENKKNPMFIEPSVAEKVEYANTCVRLNAAQKLLGGAYSLLLLGLEVQEEHHIECGRSRVSKTYTDRNMFETFYDFCTFVVWITFRRKEFDCVKQEIGRLLRSDTFNPALRVQRAPKDIPETDPTKVPKKEETGVEKKEPEPNNKITLAQYRRLYQKRPAIKSIINQRSPAIVSILPSPKEEALWLFQHPKLQNNESSTAAPRDEQDKTKTDESCYQLMLDVTSFRAGILGEPYKQFNPQTLSPLGADNEEGNEREDGEQGLSEDDGGKEDRSQSSDLGISRQQTGISRATTEAFTDDET